VITVDYVFDFDLEVSADWDVAEADEIQRETVDAIYIMQLSFSRQQMKDL
jgi:divalent metal cation (Fe/Co/Zn/Cd) transporter